MERPGSWPSLGHANIIDDCLPAGNDGLLATCRSSATPLIDHQPATFTLIPHHGHLLLASATAKQFIFSAELRVATFFTVSAAFRLSRVALRS